MLLLEGETNTELLCGNATTYPSHRGHADAVLATLQQLTLKPGLDTMAVDVEKLSDFVNKFEAQHSRVKLTQGTLDSWLQKYQLNITGNTIFFSLSKCYVIRNKNGIAQVVGNCISCILKYISYNGIHMVARCKPLTEDHLPLKTSFSGPKGWSLVTGFTVELLPPYFIFVVAVFFK